MYIWKFYNKHQIYCILYCSNSGMSDSFTHKKNVSGLVQGIEFYFPFRWNWNWKNTSKSNATEKCEPLFFNLLLCAEVSAVVEVHSLVMLLLLCALQNSQRTTSIFFPRIKLACNWMFCDMHHVMHLTECVVS